MKIDFNGDLVTDLKDCKNMSNLIFVYFDAFALFSGETTKNEEMSLLGENIPVRYWARLMGNESNHLNHIVWDYRIYNV